MIPKLGSILKRTISIDESKLDAAAVAAHDEGMHIGKYLIEHLGISEEAVFRALSEQFAMEFEPAIEHLLNMDQLRELPPELFRDGSCLPLTSNENTIRLAIGDPLDFDSLMHIEAVTNLVADPILTTPSEIERIREQLFDDDSVFKQSAGMITREYEKKLQSTDEEMTLEEIRLRTESEPVVKMVSLIFKEAIKLRASDIHVEPSEHNAVIRFRIDGMLRQHTEVSKWMVLPLTSRIKIQADLDIAEKRVPQDGRIRYTIDGQNYDFRVSTLPTHYGEKTVIRILKHDKGLLDLVNLGVPSAGLLSIQEIIEKPQGMIFVTGPTGSGKSSTLFACLNRIRNKAINITTIENPIEYKLDGVNQVQINEKAGVTFAAVLRSILRQDPDVILIGEIRDQETAQIAVQASQTGHLVFSTLHTNDAVSAITRLRDLGVPGFLIASSLLSILAQRLVRVLCPHCKREAELSEDARRRWNALLGAYPLPRAFSAPGCEACDQIGFRGRTGVFELIAMDEELRSMISENESETALRKALREHGYRTLIHDGIAKIEEGVTTPEELLRVVLVEDFLQQP